MHIGVRVSPAHRPEHVGKHWRTSATTGACHLNHSFCQAEPDHGSLRSGCSPLCIFADLSRRVDAVGAAVTSSRSLTRDTLLKGFGLIFATFCGSVLSDFFWGKPKEICCLNLRLVSKVCSSHPKRKASDHGQKLARRSEIH